MDGCQVLRLQLRACPIANGHPHRSEVAAFWVRRPDPRKHTEPHLGYVQAIA